MMKFRKKPVVIDAMHFATNNEPDDACMNAIVIWIRGVDGVSDIETPHTTATFGGEQPAWHDGTDIYIQTREGIMRASCGDYIIRGVAGEFYPCKPDIFAATYEGVVDV